MVRRMVPGVLDEAVKKRDTDGRNAAVEYMNGQTTQKSLEWEFENSYFDTCRRFRDIEEKKDWVFVYFDDKLCFGQLEGDIKIDERHELNGNSGEWFHFRKVINQKDFPLAKLPDLARLIPQAGRGNVHQCHIV